MFKRITISLCSLQLLILPVATHAEEVPQNIFEWHCQPEAEKCIRQQLDLMIALNPAIERLQLDLLKKTSTRLQDWVDHIVCIENVNLVRNLQEAGFTLEEVTSDYETYRHLGAQLPAVVINKKDQKAGIAISIDSISD